MSALLLKVDVIDSAYPSCPFALSEVDLGVYCRRVSTVDEMPDPGLMKTWWIAMNLQTLAALHISPRVDLGIM